MKRRQSPPFEDTPTRRPRLIQPVCTQVQSSITIEPNLLMESQTAVAPSAFPEMKILKLKILWGKQRYEIEADANDSLFILRGQIFALTQVNPDRQRIIFQGRIITEETWPHLELENGSELRMIGTNDKIVMPIIVEEDAKSSSSNKKRKLLPRGLVNHGNTCYMNSVLQILRSVNELKALIINYKLPSEQDNKNSKSAEPVLITTMGELFKSLDERSENSDRFMRNVIMNIETVFPDYKSVVGDLGRPQQDANEFFVRLITILKNHLNIKDDKPDCIRDPIELLFGVDVEKTLSCTVEGGEEPSVTTQTELQLSCFIQQETKFLIDGIKSKFHEELSKVSYLLNKEVGFKIQTQITRLPSYVCVQFVRFYYKEKENINAKILRDVKFPMRLDLSGLCTEKLKEQFKPMQTQIREFENKLSLSDLEVRRTLLSSCEHGVISLPEQNLENGDSGSGIYQLTAVMTHKGRSSTEGHYVGWVRYDDKKWAKLDDYDVSIAEEEDILKLSGGGEFHCAYLLLYQAFKLPKP